MSLAHPLSPSTPGSPAVASYQKIAVVLCNLGGPDSPQAVGPFLYRLFSDPAIISLPVGLRHMVAWFIATRRTKTAQSIYAKLGGGSPILAETEAQARALTVQLQALLPSGSQCRSFVAMRYWHPMAEEALQAVMAYAPDIVLVLPLYPQFSTTTTASSLAAWQAEMRHHHCQIPTRYLCCYAEDEAFCAAHRLHIMPYLTQAFAQPHPVRLLFSAHGLPEHIITRRGDPYAWQVERSCAVIMEHMPTEYRVDWQIAYQSRVGPLPWIGPSTEAAIRQAGKDGCALVVVPIAFVSEHSETLVELDIEYQALAAAHGVPFYSRVSALGTHTGFIEALSQQCLRLLDSKTPALSPASGTLHGQSHCTTRCCPSQYHGCPLACS